MKEVPESTEPYIPGSDEEPNQLSIETNLPSGEQPLFAEVAEIGKTGLEYIVDDGPAQRELAAKHAQESVASSFEAPTTDTAPESYFDQRHELLDETADSIQPSELMVPISTILENYSPIATSTKVNQNSNKSALRTLQWRLRVAIQTPLYKQAITYGAIGALFLVIIILLVTQY